MNNLLLRLQILSAMWEVIRTEDFFIGPTTEKFEKLLRQFTGSAYAVGVSSGTDALIVALKALEIGPGDEVIVPAVSFFSSASAISWVGARPVFVDIDIKTYTIDPRLIEAAITPKTKAIIPVQLNGGMAGMELIMNIARKHGVWVISDASHAFGAQYKNQPIGMWGDLVCLSFSFNKKEFGSFGNSGAILTDNEKLFKKIIPFRLYGALSRRDIYKNHIVASGSYRIDSFQAAVLSCKIPHWDMCVKKRRALYLFYKETLADISDIVLPDEGVDCFHAGYRFIFLTHERDGLRTFLKNAGIRSVHYYDTPLPFFPAFKNLHHSQRDFSISEKFARESISLPTDSTVTQSDAEKIVGLIRKYMTSVDVV